MKEKCFTTVECSTREMLFSGELSEFFHSLVHYVLFFFLFLLVVQSLYFVLSFVSLFNRFLLFPRSFVGWSFFCSCLRYLFVLLLLNAFVPCSFVRLFVRLFVCSFARLFVSSFARQLIYSFLHSFVCAFVPSLDRWFVRLFVRSLLRSVVYSFVRSFVCSCVRAFVHSLVRSFFSLK